jgi:hypothetical protein
MADPSAIPRVTPYVLSAPCAKSCAQATAEDFAATFESPTQATAEAAAATAQEALLVQSGAGELYVRLLCEFEPAAVLSFLQAHDAYRVEEVLPYTQCYGVDDAQVSNPPI